MFISEAFVSIDGEGVRAGQRAIFVRFAGCNLISTTPCLYCDTRYALAKSQANAAYTCAADVVEAVTKFCVEGVVNNITITGGEPLLYPDDICDILDQLDQTQFAFSINIETNGTISPVEFIEKYKRTNFAHCLLNDLFFTFDIKTHSAGEAARAACMQGDTLLPVIASYTPYMNTFTRKYNDVIKAVVGSREDLDYIRKIYTSWITRPHEYQWYISPVFGKIEPCDLVEYVLTHNDCAAWRVQIQMHKIIWDSNKRGV